VKKTILLLSIIALFFISVFVSAEESDLYVKTVYIEKIYTHRLGFKLIYPVGTQSLGTLYIPHSWSGYAGARAAVIYGYGDNYPYMEIFWANGEFSHLKLYVMENPYHQSWGVLQNSEVPEGAFDVEIENFEVKF